jgi:superoxide dismutase, Cu-Zn family
MRRLVVVALTVRVLVTVVVALSVAVSGCQTIRPAGQEPTATAELMNAADQSVGSARLAGALSWVRIVVEISGLPPGPKAVHIHAVGRCDPPDFLSAGDHLNPSGVRHGLLNPEGPHAGDLPNITIEPNGTGRFETSTRRITLAAGPATIFDEDGSALVVHAGPDDFRTDPDGGSGQRIACGVITQSLGVDE